MTNQERYRLLEQWGMYSDMKPLLIRNDVTIIDTAFSDTLVTFESGAEHYTIDLRPYRVRDGVVLFQPGKKPVFWSDRSLGFCCDVEESFWSYFDKKRESN